MYTSPVHTLTPEVPATTAGESISDSADSPSSTSNDTSLVFSEPVDRGTQSRVVSDATTFSALSNGATSTSSIQNVSGSTADGHGKVDHEVKAEVEAFAPRSSTVVPISGDGQVTPSEIDMPLAATSEQLPIQSKFEGLNCIPESFSLIQSEVLPDVPVESSQPLREDGEAGKVAKSSDSDARFTENEADELVAANDKQWEAAFASREMSFENEMEDLVDEHIDELKHQKQNLQAQHVEELSLLRVELAAKHALELTQLREEMQAATEALQKKSQLQQAHQHLGGLYDYLQNRHAETLQAVEDQKKITQTKDQEILQLRQRIYDAVAEYNQEKQQVEERATRLQQQNAVLQMTLGRDKITCDAVYAKLANAQVALEDNPKAINSDQKQLIKLKESQLAKIEEQLFDLSKAYDIMECEAEKAAENANARIEDLERELKLEVDKTGFLSERNDYLETYSEDVVTRISRRMQQSESVVILNNSLALADLENTTLSNRVTALEKRLQQSELDAFIWKEKHRDLSEEASIRKSSLDKCMEEKRALLTQVHQLEYSMELKEKELKDFSEEKAQGSTWRDDEITRLKDHIENLGRLSTPEHARWVLKHKETVIENLRYNLEIAQKQLSDLQQKTAEAEWLAGFDRQNAGYSDYVDEMKRKRFEDTQAELEELRAAKPEYNSWLRQEAASYRHQLKVSEENVKELSEQLEILQESCAEFEDVKVVLADLLEGQESDTVLRDELKAQNDQLRKLGFRVYTQMMWLEATLRANNKVVADDSWDALIAESEELFYDSNELGNEMYDSNGFPHETPGKGKERDIQGSPTRGGLIPRPLFSKENTPEAQDANAGKGGNSGAEDLSDHQVDSNPKDMLNNAGPANGGILNDFAKANLLLNSRMLAVSEENPDDGIEQSYTDSSSDISANYERVHQENPALAGNPGTINRSLPSLVNVERQSDVKTEEKVVTQEVTEADTGKPHRLNTSTGLENGSYDLSQEEAKILDQTGRFPHRFALPSTQIEEAKRYLYTGSDCGDTDEEGDSQDWCEQEEDVQETVGPEENKQTGNGQDGGEQGSPVEYTQQNNIFYFAAKPSAAQDTNTKPKFNFTVTSSYPQAEDVKDNYGFRTEPNSSLGNDYMSIFQFTAASSGSSGNGNKDILSFTGDSSSPLNNHEGKGIFNFTASSTLKESVTAQIVDGESKVDEGTAGEDSDTSTVVLEPLKVPSSIPVADDQAKDVGHVEIDTGRATSAIKSLYHGETANPSTTSEDTLDLSAVRDGQEIPVSYTLPAVKDKKREKAKAPKDDEKTALKVGGRRIHRKIRL